MFVFEKKFYQICDKLVIAIKWFIGVLFFFMLLTIIFQVVWRNILTLSSPWTEEVSVYLMTYITYIGGIAVLIRGEHLAIDLVTERCPAWMKEWFQVLYIFVFLFVCTYMTIYGAKFCLNPLMQAQKSIATGIPRVYIYMIMPVSMAVCDIYCLFDLFFIFRRMGKKQTAIQQGG